MSAPAPPVRAPRPMGICSCVRRQALTAREVFYMRTVAVKDAAGTETHKTFKMCTPRLDTVEFR